MGKSIRRLPSGWVGNGAVAVEKQRSEIIQHVSTVCMLVRETVWKQPLFSELILVCRDNKQYMSDDGKRSGKKERPLLLRGLKFVNSK